MEIILVRHGKPIIPSLNKINALSFKFWVEQYNSSELSSSSMPSKELLAIAKKCNAFVCSGLPRSIQSVTSLNIDNITLSHSQFNEAGLPNANWSMIKLSPMTWAVIFRLLWLFGYANNSESFKDAKMRAKASAQTLIKSYLLQNLNH